jgi:hypothetical protein
MCFENKNESTSLYSPLKLRGDAGGNGVIYKKPGWKRLTE